MRFAFLTQALLVFLSMACSGGSAPTTPSSTSADLPSWQIDLNGDIYDVDLGGLLEVSEK